MKKTLSLILSLVMVMSIFVSVPVTASAENKNDLIFQLNEDGESYTVVGFSEIPSGNFTIPDEYNNKPVTSVGREAFYDCTNLTSVTIPDSVTSIGDFAFRSCTSLASIELPDTVTNIGISVFEETAYYNKSNNWKNKVLYISNHLIKAKETLSGEYVIKVGTSTIANDAFYFCTKLTGITLPDSLRNIGRSAFSCCSRLTSIKIPAGVKRIEEFTFESCKNLTTVEIPDTVTSIGDAAFYSCASLTKLTLPDSVESMGTDVFSNCIKLTKVTIPAGVKTIGDSTFLGCTSLKSITIPNSVTSIGDYAFSDCTSLKTVKIGNSVTSISYAAFQCCTSLPEVTIPASVKSIGESSFADCESLTKITVSKKNTEYSSSKGVLFDKNKTTLIKYPEGKSSVSYKIPGSVKTIGEAAFAGCRKLTSIQIPSSVKNIGSNAFLNCTSLKTVEMHYGLKSVGSCAFEGCEKLKSVKIPATVKEINNYAFGYYFDENEWETYKVKNFKIYGKKGTEAQKYAKNNGFGFVAVTKPGKAKLKTIANASSGVKLTWNKIEKADYYEIYRKVKGGSYECIGTTTSVSYIDKTTKSGTNYYYVIKSVNSAGKSAVSNTLSIKFLAAPTLKSIATAKAGVTIKWDQVTGASGYKVYRQTGSGNYVEVATVKKGTTVSYVDKSAKKGKTYTYKVKAYSGKTTSAFSNTKKIKDKY